MYCSYWRKITPRESNEKTGWSAVAENLKRTRRLFTGSNLATKQLGKTYTCMPRWVVELKRLMKKLSISVVAGLLTFSIGVIVTVVWMTRNTPELGNPPSPSGLCVPAATQGPRFRTVGEDGYFPRGLLSRNPQIDELTRSAYAKYLAPMKEPSLPNSPASDNNEVYRFTWLRSFHPGVVVRVWSDAGVRMLTVKEFIPANEKQVARMSVDQTRRLEEDEWAEFARLFDEA